jgi:hypothetical protein
LEYSRQFQSFDYDATAVTKPVAFEYNETVAERPCTTAKTLPTRQCEEHSQAAKSQNPGHDEDTFICFFNPR